jgi:hypothetical protein
MKKKKAQGISINTIIIAAIALIVMVLVILIFTGNIRNFRKSAGSCEGNGGVCVASEDTCKDDSAAGYQGRVLSQYNEWCTDNYPSKPYCCLTAKKIVEQTAEETTE